MERMSSNSGLSSKTSSTHDYSVEEELQRRGRLEREKKAADVVLAQTLRDLERWKAMIPTNVSMPTFVSRGTQTHSEASLADFSAEIVFERVEDLLNENRRLKTYISRPRPYENHHLCDLIVICLVDLAFYLLRNF